jgi:hypothetical protein
MTAEPSDSDIGTSGPRRGQVPGEGRVEGHTDADRFVRVVARTLKRLYPQSPDVVLGREARIIVEALGIEACDTDCSEHYDGKHFTMEADRG